MKLLSTWFDSKIGIASSYKVIVSLIAYLILVTLDVAMFILLVAEAMILITIVRIGILIRGLTMTSSTTATRVFVIIAWIAEFISITIVVVGSEIIMAIRTWDMILIVLILIAILIVKVSIPS
jgi:hypothetical protein